MFSGNRFRNFTLVAAALALLPALADAQSRSTFRCTGNDGKKYYGNTVPPQCYGRLVEQLNAQGMVIKRMDPDANDGKDLETKAAEKAAKEKYDAANRETQRRNRALLATYTSEKDIEEQRGRALSDNQKTVREIEQRVADLKKRRASFDKELEFYQDKKGAPAKVPPKLQEEIRQAEFDLKVQEESLETKKKEVSNINAKYDDDKKRFAALTKR
jgi:chromosome segregation ATPase